jgi:hypothetical protein
VVYVSDRLVVYWRSGGATRGKRRILDGKVESGLMSDLELQGGSPPPMLIEDRLSDLGEQD